jgi:threonylcarbamoyladenosine tRNA methylthiotransferase MtaB
MPATFYIEQFGCRATQADAAAIERQLLDRGCTPVRDAAAAQFVVVNTCTVTAAADSQARDAIRKIHASNPTAQIVATGCYAQRAPEDLATLPGVSWVVGNSHKPQIAQLIARPPSAPASNPPRDFVPITAIAPRTSASPVGAQHAAPQLGTMSAIEISAPRHSLVVAQHAAPAHPQILTSDILAHSHFLSAPVLGGESEHTRPTLKIQDGCNLRCSYCVIPFVRGKSRSLPPDEVIAEIRRLTVEPAFLITLSPEGPVPTQWPVPAGASSEPFEAREIVLSGINLGTYGRDLSPRAELLPLLLRILGETQIERLRLSSIEPQDVTQELIDLFASTDRLADHFHMPLQSASDNILAAMHRWYRAEHYARRVELIRDRIPHAAIGADVIAGFPGETEADHAATLAFIDRLPFTYLHVFSYSSRPGTHAATLPNQVPAHVIKRRARELRSLSESKSAAFRQSQIGRTLRVLTLRPNSPIQHQDGPPAAAQYTPALSSNYLRVQLPGAYVPNTFHDARIASVENSHLISA